jgi:hypothetical protein
MTEQLRTIHLTLLLICLVLLAATFAERHGPLKRAYEQATMIEKWSQGEHQVTSLLLTKAEKLFKEDETPNATATRKHREALPYVRLSFNGTTVLSIKRDRFLYGVAGGRREENFQPLTSSSSIYSWETLDHFIGTWNASHLVVENPLLTRPEFDTRREITSSCGPVVMEPSSTPESGVYSNPYYYVSDTKQLGLDAYFESPVQYKRDSVSYDGHKHCEIKQPLGEVEPGRLDVRGALRQVLDANLSTAQFNEAFPDLYESTKYLTSLTLEDLKQHLREEADKEGEKVEMFGAKIPYDLVSVFGAMLLVACQFYLWCHLVAFTAYLSKEKTYDFTGYIGLYTGQLAIRIFTLLSVSLVPIAVLGLTIWKSRHNEWWEWIFPSVALPLSVLLGVLLVRRFRQVWDFKSIILNGEADLSVPPGANRSLPNG